MGKKIIAVTSFRSIRYFVFVLIALIMLKTIVDNVLGFNNYRNVFNMAIFVAIVAMVGSLVHTMKKDIKVDEFKKEISCSPLILLVTGIFVVMMGSILLFVGVYIGILFLCLGIIMLFESLTTKIIVTDDGITVKCHKIFPFPGIFYPFNNLSEIKTKGRLINLKQKQIFPGAKRFLIFDIDTFIKQVNKTPIDMQTRK